MNKITTTILAGTLAVAGLAACGEKSKSTQAQNADRTASANALLNFQNNQPAPQLDWSQLRQNLIELEVAQAHTTQTTSFMFLQAGSGATGPLLHWCPSIGFPIPATDQLTNPESKVVDHDLTLPQQEVTGVFTGDTTGTYVLCVGGDGKPYAFYHEGFVSTVTGPAHWDTAKGEIVMDGPSSFEFTKAKK